MKKFLILFFFALLLLPLRAWEELDYGRPENWVLCEKDKSGAAYDLFYLYPTISAKKDRIFLDLQDEKTMQKMRDFVRAQTGIFISDSRVFAPVVRELELDAICAAQEHPDDPNLQKTIGDLLQAFRFYRQNFQQGRPFVLVGHSQGAIALYEMLKQEQSAIVRDGFVAAYLIGLPQVTQKKILTDFQPSGIAPAQAADDVAVIVVWNSQSRDAENSPFATPGGYCINPLNWQTNATMASCDENAGAFFYDYRDGSSKRIPRFCGAVVDPAKGALIVDLPSGGEWDANGFFGKGVFHMNDIWFFAENMRQNILLRVCALQSKENR